MIQLTYTLDKYLNGQCYMTIEATVDVDDDGFEVTAIDLFDAKGRKLDIVYPYTCEQFQDVHEDSIAMLVHAYDPRDEYFA